MAKSKQQNSTDTNNTRIQEIEQQLQDRSYKRGFVPKEQQNVFTIGGSIIGSLQNFIVFSGLPKAGKSTFLHGAIASNYIPAGLFSMNMNLPIDRKGICYIDTESGEYDFYSNIMRIRNMSTRIVLPDDFYSYRFRDCNPVEILYYIEYLLTNNQNISVMVVDGLLDLLLNYNDEVESRKLINWLKKITTQHNILLIGVVHTGKKDGLTLGHFGSMVDRYCQSVLMIEKDSKNDLFELKPKLLRSSGDFEPIKIKYVAGQYEWVNQPAWSEQNKPF